MCRILYKAHINEKGETQTVKQHSENTARLCYEYSVPALKDFMYTLGLLHDVGKYQPSFQKRISGNSNIHIEHSTCGAKAAQEHYDRVLATMMQYCIAGHHTGIPNSGSKIDSSDMSTLYGRLKRETEDYSAYKDELDLARFNEKSVVQFLCDDCDNDMGKLVDKFSFLTRYCFSCLTDADSVDTSTFCKEHEEREMLSNFKGCLDSVNKRLSSFVCKTNLQRARAVIQNQVFDKAEKDSEIYLMDMPTGSGKTLCSLKFALERAIRTGKKRIIYIIPYNSIIDQTADEFESMLAEDAQILRHQSTFAYTDINDEDYKQVIRFATENWNSQFIITTSVQFFESIYSNKRGKLRKLHNMSDSILIFDEAHLMPTEYLQPCLQAVSYITRYLNSEAIFLTATMPDFRELISKYALSSSKIIDLVEDKSNFSTFNKCTYSNAGELSDEALLNKACKFPSSLIVVNKRKTAQRLYSLCSGKKYHLSTYMTAFDRKRTINEIKKELKKLEEDFPDIRNVPPDRHITVISTSLIEAGVDFDFYTVFRELSGLDSILQAGGRCNREGKRKVAEVYIFSAESERGKPLADERANITNGLINKFDDISCCESVSAYYEQLYFVRSGDIVKNSMSQYCSDIYSIPFKDYSDRFELIDTNMISVVVPQDENQSEIEMLRETGHADIRKLREYAFSVYRYEFEELLSQHVVEEYGNGVWCLTNKGYYNDKTGISFEARDYII